MTFYKNKTLEVGITPQSSLIHSDYPDLVNNYVFYHSQVPEKDLKVWKNKPPLYSNYPSIKELSDKFLDNPQKYYDSGPISVRCPISYFYTCDSELSKIQDELTYDRLYDFKPIKDKAVNVMKNPEGFSPRSDILHGMVRWIFDDNENIIGFVINKDRGNLRSYIAFSTTAGKDVELCITLDFHEPKYQPSENLRQIESETFTEDAVDRRNFVATQKFRGAYLAKRKPEIALADFLDEMDVDYANVISKVRKKRGDEAPKYSLTSTQGLTFSEHGADGGDIAKYGKENTEIAIQTLKAIVDERNASNLEKRIELLPMSAIQTFVKTFYYLCETPEKIKLKNTYETSAVICKNKLKEEQVTPQEYLKEFLIYFFTAKDRHEKFYKNSINEIQKSGSQKDTSWFAFKVYMKDLLLDLKNTKNQKNNRGIGHACLLEYKDTISDRYLQDEASKILSSMPTN